MKELPRRLWHIFGGLSLPAAGLWAPQDIFLPALVSITIAALILDIVRLRSPRVNRRFVASFRALLREREVSTLTGSTYFLIAASIVFIFCDKSIAAIALAFVAVGDPVAGMVGERWGKPRVSPEEGNFPNFAKFPRNLRFRRMGGKSLEGSSACFVACLVVGVILAAVTHVALWVVVVGAICATVVESLPLLVNDNLSIPLVAAGVMSLVHAIVV
jgi:glycerol-3-phosphate acyltransferase PlsY